MIEATKVTDSISDHGVRLLTIKGKVPETIWNEILTHRVFSRNSSSSRAVPAKKWVEETRSRDLRVTPMRWGVNQKGMQQGDELTGDALRHARDLWNSSACDAAYWAEKMMNADLHKEIVNQSLKPYIHAHVVITATEWMNFFGLRLDKAAKIEIRTFAEQVWRIWNESTPLHLDYGQWHLPFYHYETDDVALEAYMTQNFVAHETMENYRIKVSIARCARVSYESHETGKRSTVEADVKLHDFLLMNREMSPFEHQATPDEMVRISSGYGSDWVNKEEHGNFLGWRQRRKMIKGEAIAPLPESYNA